MTPLLLSEPSPDEGPGRPQSPVLLSPGLPCWKRRAIQGYRSPAHYPLNHRGGGGCIRREGTSERLQKRLVRQAVGGGCQSGWGRLLSDTKAIEAGTCRQGDSGWVTLQSQSGHCRRQMFHRTPNTPHKKRRDRHRCPILKAPPPLPTPSPVHHAPHGATFRSPWGSGDWGQRRFRSQQTLTTDPERA